MIVVGFVSSYCEGRLVRAAIESVLEVDLDRLYVYEGPAGAPLEPELEGRYASELDELRLALEHGAKVTVERGRWRTDARKRDAWLQRVKRDYAGEKAWAVVVDADEVLVGGRYLRDRLEFLLELDEHRGASIATPENPPMARWPLHLVEHDGSMSLITARVFRVDLLRSIDHSSSVVTGVTGVRDGWGNYPEASRVWLDRWLAAIDAGQMIAWPPLPATPYLVHRSNLRPPARASLRMSAQETEEFARAIREERGEPEPADVAGFDFERRP